MIPARWSSYHDLLNEGILHINGRKLLSCTVIQCRLLAILLYYCITVIQCRLLALCPSNGFSPVVFSCFRPQAERILYSTALLLDDYNHTMLVAVLCLQHCSVLHFTTLYLIYHTKICFTLPDCTALYCTSAHYTVLYHTALY